MQFTLKPNPFKQLNCMTLLRHFVLKTLYHTGLGTANKFDDYIENINIKPNFALL